jgi:SNF2 family DNA or RNA helicase
VPAYRLSACVITPEGARCALSRAGATLGQEALAFPALLSNFVPGLAVLGTKASVLLDEEELGTLVVEAAPLLSRIGVSVVLPKELSKLARPRPVLQAKKRKGSGGLATVFDLGSAFSFEWKIAIGEELVDPAEFEALVKKGTALFRFRAGYVRLDPGEAAALVERIRRERRPDTLGALKAALSGEVEFEGEFASAIEGLLAGAADKAGRKSPDARPLPAGLKATLRPYQERGYRWLLANLEKGFGCLLADDMGLGKTVQTIATALALKETGNLGRGALVVAPASLLTNWERELGKFAPSLTIHSHYGSKRRLAEADIVLTTYDTFLRDAAKFAEREWDLAVLDEAHLIKNPDTKRSHAVKALRATRRIALTGTPVENNLAELWSIFDFVIPGYLGNLVRFAKDFRTPIEVNRSPETAERLRRITSPFLLRRLKTDKAIAPDLPEKVIIEEYAALTAEQAGLYEAAVSEGLARIEEAEGIGRRGLVLALITALKQISNHPRNWDKESEPLPERSGKASLLLALLDSAMEAGERVLVFSQYVEMLEILRAVVKTNLGIEPYMLHGGMSTARRDEAVDRFQNEIGPGIFLVSLKAGGIGLNLTAANRVVHYDLWFNPAVESQATDRAFRIGQTKNVFVHRLVTRGTLEEKIDAALASKRELAELTVGAGETWISELGNEELRDLVALR